MLQNTFSKYMLICLDWTHANIERFYRNVILKISYLKYLM